MAAEPPLDIAIAIAPAWPDALAPVGVVVVVLLLVLVLADEDPAEAVEPTALP